MTLLLRRRELIAAGTSIGFATLAGCSGLLGDDAVEGWPMFQRGPAHHGVNASTAGPGADLGVRWRAEADRLAGEFLDAPGTAFVSSPVVQDGTVYVSLGLHEEDASFHLVALDVEDGSSAWRTEIATTFGWNGWPLPQPAVVDDTVVVPNTGLDGAVPLAGVDVESGDVTWRYEGDDVPVGPVTAGEGVSAVGSKTAFAVDADGRLAWEFGDEDDPARARLDYPPTITGGGIYVPTRSGLFALDHDGAERWSRELSAGDGEDSRAWPYTPVADGDLLYVVTGNLGGAGDGRLLALDPEDGTTLWTFEPSVDGQAADGESGDPRRTVGVYTTPALADGTLFVPGYTIPEDEERALPRPMFYAVDADAGEREWSVELPGLFDPIPPVVADGMAYVATDRGIAAIDLEDEEVSETGDVGRGPLYGLALADDTIYAGAETEVLAVGPE